jgi:ribosomal protein L7/L12
MNSFPPHYCAVCGRCFSNEYFHTQGGGVLIAFADFDDSGVKQGLVPGIRGVAWICNQHVNAAQERAGFRTDDAIRDLQRSLGVSAAKPAERQPSPELFLVEVGPNRARVSAVVRQATGLSPKHVRDLLHHAPVKIAEGWPAEFETWRKRLCDVGAKVEIRWD